MVGSLGGWGGGSGVIIILRKATTPFPFKWYCSSVEYHVELLLTLDLNFLILENFYKRILYPAFTALHTPMTGCSRRHKSEQARDTLF